MSTPVFVQTTTNLRIDPNFWLASSAAGRVSSSPYAFFKLEQFPLVDELTQRRMQSIGVEAGIITTGSFGNGLRLRPSSTYSYDFLLRNQTQFSIGFWLMPVNLAPTINSISGQLQKYRMGLLDKSMYSYDSLSNFISAQQTTFSVFEECEINNQNTMKILLQDNITNNQVIVSSDLYNAQEWHYFWLTYDGLVKNLSLYIDGILSGLSFDQGSVIPSSIANFTSTPLHVNFSAVGNISFLRSNSGILDELILLDITDSDERNISRHINLGTEFVINSALETRNETYQAFMFDDPTALSVKSALSNGDNIYVGRNDGKIYKGSRLVWQARKNFSDPNEINYIRPSLLAASSEATTTGQIASDVSVAEGSLRITKASVRI